MCAFWCTSRMELFVDNNNNIIHNNNNTINCIFASLCVYVTRVYMHKCLHGVCVCGFGGVGGSCCVVPPWGGTQSYTLKTPVVDRKAQ